MANILKTELTLNDKNFSAGINSACKKAQSSLNQVSATTKGFGGILGGLSGQIGGAISSLSGLAGSVSSLCNPYTAAAAAVAAGATAFFNYNKNLSETRDLVEQFTGLDGAQLDSLRNGIQAVADVAGKDFREVLSAVDGLMSQFGIDGETALKIVQDGFVAGADDSGKFLDMLNQYSGSFNDIGVSADELTAIIAQTRSGIFSEDGMAAIQMAGKNIRTLSSSAKESLNAIGISADEMESKLQNGTMTTMDAIKQISGQLKQFPAQSKEVGDVLQDVFGKKGSAAGYELVTALSEVSTNLEEVKKQTGEDGVVMENLINASREFENALQSLFGCADQGFDDLYDIMKTKVLTTLTQVINRFIDLYNKSTVVRAGFANLATGFKNAWTIIKAICKQFVISLEGIADVLEDLVTGNFGKIGDDVKKTYKSLADSALDSGREIGDNIREGINQALHGHIDKIETVAPDPTPKGKGGRESSPGSKGGTGGTGSSGKGGKSSSTSSPKAPTYTDGSLSDLEAKLSELKKKYKDGLISITPEDYKQQVSDLEKQISDMEIALGIKPQLDDNSLAALENKLQTLQADQKSGKIQLNADDFKEQVADLEKQIKSKKIELGLSLDRDELDKQFHELKSDPKLSSFEMAVGVDKPQGIEEQLEAVAQQMDQNDELLKQLEELKEAYAALGDAGAEGFTQVSEKIAEVNAQQAELGNSAKELNQTSKATKKLAKNFGKAGDAIGDMGSAFSALGSATESPELNIAGTIAQGIASIIAGAGSATAQASEMGPWAWIAFSIAAMAQVAAMVAQIHSLASYANGGMLNNGINVGDKNLVRVNGNEAILNQHQQGRLWQLINSSSTLDSPTTNGNVEFKIRGSELVGVINNYTKKRSRI